MTEKMDKFLDEVDELCFKYHYEIRPNNDKTILIFDEYDGEEQLVLYIDGDGRGK